MEAVFVRKIPDWLFKRKLEEHLFQFNEAESVRKTIGLALVGFFEKLKKEG